MATLQHVGQPEKEKTPGDTQGSFSCLSLVGRRGFEPLISALRVPTVLYRPVLSGTISAHLVHSINPTLCLESN